MVDFEFLMNDDQKGGTKLRRPGVHNFSWQLILFLVKKKKLKKKTLWIYIYIEMKMSCETFFF